MFAHVSPEGDSSGETISTLKFAQRVSSVELGAARLNKESTEVLELKAEVKYNHFMILYGYISITVWLKCWLQDNTIPSVIPQVGFGEGRVA